MENVAKTAHAARMGDRQAVQVQCVLSNRLSGSNSVCEGRYGLSVRIKSLQSGNDGGNGVRELDLLARWTGSRTPVHRYARHGRELVGCKSPVRKWELLWRT